MRTFVRVANFVHLFVNMSSPNVHVSQHPCLRAKLSQLRSHETNARETKQLVHEIATIVGCEALASALKVVEVGKACNPNYANDILTAKLTLGTCRTNHL